MPKLYIIAGPNGSGKTTFAKEFLPKFAKCSNFVNADLIALGLSPFAPNKVNIKAGKLLLSQINGFIEDKVDFAFESTLAGKTYLNLIKRVKQGGHDVPVEDIKRRFQRSYDNFIKLYQPLCDSWIMFDNAGIKFEEIERSITGDLI